MRHARGRLGLAVAVLGLVVGMATQTKATLIVGNGDPLSAIPGGSQITFTGNSVSPTTGATTIGGVTFGQGDGLTYFINSAYGGSYNTTGESLQNGYGGTQQFTFNFASPVNAFAFNFGASDDVWTLTAYDSGHQVIESDLLTPPTFGSNAGEFFGIQAPGIASATLTDITGVSNDYVLIDNFTYSSATLATPEPSTLVSAGIAGLIGLGYGWRRRKANHTA